MKNMRVKDLGITKRRKGVKNGKNIGAASRISVAYRLPVSAKLKLVEISNALGLSERAAFVAVQDPTPQNIGFALLWALLSHKAMDVPKHFPAKVVLDIEID